MKNEKSKQKQLSMTFLMALLFLLCSSLVLTGCSSAEGKTKKKKAPKDHDEDEVTSVEKDSHKDEDHDSEKEAEKGDDHKDANKKADSKDDKHKDDKHKKDAKNEKKPSADEIWADLESGNKLFRKGKYSIGNILGERGTLAKGQEPQVIIIGCSDSRVPPELIFGKNTGDLFVVRDAGNIVDEVTLGSMEYAVEHLHSKAIVVLGHDSCGAVAATVSGEKMPSINLQAIVDTIAPAIRDSGTCEIGGKMNPSCVELNVNQTAKNILSKSPILKKATEEGLVILKAVYHLETGEVERLK